MFTVTVTAKFLTHAKKLNTVYRTVAYNFLNVCEKFTSLCQLLKRCTQKKTGSFIQLHGVVFNEMYRVRKM